MKNTRTLIAGFVVAATLISVNAFAQAPNLGSAAGFLFFTSVGAVGNTGTSAMTGNAGTDVGAITGLDGLNGNVYNADPVTEQAAIDVLNAYNELTGTPATSPHSGTFGNDEKIFAGVYYTLSAASLNGTLVLDAQNNANAIFIFKIGGALTIADAAAILLTNGALAANIFWVTEGAVSIGAMTSTAGTFLANNGALNIGDGSTLEGRLLSTSGAIVVSNSVMSIPNPIVLSLGTSKLSGKCVEGDLQFEWEAAVSEGIGFSVQGSADGLRWTDLGSGSANFHNSSSSSFTLTYRSTNNLLTFYRLMETGISGREEYGSAIRLQSCASTVAERVVLYPNPSPGQFRIKFTQRSNEVYRVSVFNSQGKRVFSSNGIPAGINLSRQPPGVYQLSIQSKSSSTHQKIVINGN